MTTGTSSLAEALARFPCGPGGHRLTSGLSLGGFGTDMAWIPLCEDCGKRVDAATCLFCDASAAGAGLPSLPGYDVLGPEGRRAHGWICGACLGPAVLGDGTGWTLAMTRGAASGVSR